MSKRNPARTKEAILAAATEEFSQNGLDGARVNQIAKRAGINKRMLYHYFGNKDDLFLAVLEAVYQDIRTHELELNLEALAPMDAMRELVDYTFDYYIANPHFIRLLNNENLYGARHLKRSKAITTMHSPLVNLLDGVLEKGVKEGAFRKGVDPIQLYISIAGVCYFYMSNIDTLSTIFATNLRVPKAIKVRREHAANVILGYLRE
jgi:AcrR family transcriptional regulator